MNFIKVNGEFINLENVYFVNKDEKERLIKISYCLNDKMIEYEIDYSDVQDDVNEEKTKLQQDFERIESFILNKVVPEEELKEAESAIIKLKASKIQSHTSKERLQLNPKNQCIILVWVVHMMKWVILKMQKWRFLMQ